jgi:hypothetical protein
LIQVSLQVVEMCYLDENYYIHLVGKR